MDLRFCVLPAALLISAALVVSATTPPIPPTAPILSEIDVEATALTDVGCDDVGGTQCYETPWVYCIDAACSEPDENALSTCDCWLQAPSQSRAPPNADAGATCVIERTGVAGALPAEFADQLYGQDMCDAMKNGTLYSTFGYLSEDPDTIPPFAVEPCPADTPFTYCWGAPCVQTEDDMAARGPNAVQCACPYVSAPSVNVQVQESQCLPELNAAGSVCEYLHNGNPSNATEAVKIAAEVWYKETDVKQDIFPTCQNFVPAVSLEAVDCAEHVDYTTTAPWVYCIDAICLPPANGVSDCYCWKQAASESIAPGSAQSGASCVRNQQTLGALPVVYGEELQQRMEAGELWSTYGGLYGNSSFVAPLAMENCPPDTPFAYCFGAKCRDDPTNSNRAICECPSVTSATGSTIGVDRNTNACAEQIGNYCSFPHNGGPHDWKAWYEANKIWEATFPGESFPTTCDGSEWSADADVQAAANAKVGPLPGAPPEPEPEPEP